MNALERAAARRPPTFHEAESVRHKAWAAGFDPDHWYAVEFADRLAPGDVTEVRFQGDSYALYRARDGTYATLEDRCAHRQVKLSDGLVRQCNLVCRYHGWMFDKDGRLAGLAEDESVRGKVKARVKSFPTVVKYGLVFVFFGDPALADSKPLPHIAVLEGENPWFHVPIDYKMKCHPTAYINNVMDSTHVATLHTKYNTRSFLYGKVTRCEAEGDRVVVAHEVELDRRGLLPHIIGRLENTTQEAWYDYPYMHVHVGGVSELWNFMLPMDGNTTRLFLLSCAKNARMPFTGKRPPAFLARPFTKVARAILVKPLFDEDVWSTEAEQLGYEAHFDAPQIDPHPSIRPCYELTARKWAEYLERSGVRA